MKTLIVVTHLLGTGHLARALVLARAFCAAGHRVIVASGGMPAPHLKSDGVELLQLPPLRSDGVNFRTLLDRQGAPVSGSLLAERKEKLLDTLHEFRPDVLLTELFPFGRRVLAEEFTSLLTAAQALTPVICTSVRDILAPPSKPAKARMADDLIERFYTAILVHSDAAITPLATSWPVSAAWADKLRYTGFVAPGAAGPHPDALGEGEILVTSGGGSVGMQLFETAIAAAALAPEHRWRVLVGGDDAPARIARLRSDAPPNAEICSTSPGFRQMLNHASASVSFCGYNTALDILQAGTPAVFVPFDDGGEVEQSLRASTLSNLPGIEVLRTQDLSADTLLQKLRTAIAAPPRPKRTDGFHGAAETVRIVTQLLSEHSA
ncbi:MAG: glycosyltransferase [Pseudomonadota bacterium]